MSSIYADEGTAAHQVLEECLKMIYEVGFPMNAGDFVGSLRTIEDGPHGRLSPSGAKRWMTCPGAPSMEAKFPEEPAGPRKVDVTLEMAEAVQQALDYVEERVAELEEQYHDPLLNAQTGVPPERQEWPVAQPRVEVASERRVSLYDILGTHDCDGTSDITLLVVNACEETLYIEQIDYKHGAGVPVSEHDPQNEFYLMGSALAVLSDELDPGEETLIESARVTIIQPRCEKVEPRIRWREIPDFKAWAGSFRDVAQAAVAAVDVADVEPTDKYLVASEDGCRFCSAKGACAEHTRFALASAGVIDEYLPVTEPVMYEAAEDFARRDNRLLTPDQFVAILAAKDILVGALQAVEGHVQKMLEDGTANQAIRNRFKLVRKQTRRAWGLKDTTELERRLKKLKGVDTKTGKLRALGKKDLYVTKMDSVAGIERTLKAMTITPPTWSAFKLLVDKPEGSLTIAPQSDPRDAVEVKPTTPADAFGDGAPTTPPNEEVAQ